VLIRHRDLRRVTHLLHLIHLQHSLLLNRIKGIINLRPHKDIIHLRCKGIIHLRPKGIIHLLPRKGIINPRSTTLLLGPDHRPRRLGTCLLLISHIRC
jgi:hypothetical protein